MMLTLPPPPSTPKRLRRPWHCVESHMPSIKNIYERPLPPPPPPPIYHAFVFFPYAQPRAGARCSTPNILRTSLVPAPSRMHSGGQRSTSGHVIRSRRLLDPSSSRRYTSTLPTTGIPAICTPINIKKKGLRVLLLFSPLPKILATALFCGNRQSNGFSYEMVCHSVNLALRAIVERRFCQADGRADARLRKKLQY